MVDEIADEMQIPRSFLAKLLQKLAKAKIVESHRGAKGGFRLARNPAEISLYDVIKASEGPVTMNICTTSKQRCGLSATCRVHPVWVAVRGDIEALLQSRKFSEFL